MSKTRLASLVLAVLLLAAPAAPGDSPQFRGPARNGIFPESGLLAAWPDGGPPLLWAAEGLGTGFASVSVADGRVYTTGADGRKGSAVALDLDGKILWRTEYGGETSGEGYPGARTTPTWNDGMLYLMSTLGSAVALDAASGEIVWQKDLPKRDITWGIVESPLVVDDKVIFTPGGAAGTMMALDKETGAEIWVVTDPNEPSGYCSPVLFEQGGERQIVTLTKSSMFGVDPDSGRRLWKTRYPAQYGIHAVSPAFEGRRFYVSDGYGQGGKMFELAAGGAGVSLLWEESTLDVHHGGAVQVDGRVYGAASNGTWSVLDAATGKVLAEKARLGKGSVVYADGKLYGYVESGKVLLVEPDPASFEVISSFEIERGSGHHWAHPVIADGVLYVRHGDALMAFDVAAD
jgi:outer membrane protein assembly factor BamB